MPEFIDNMGVVEQGVLTAAEYEVLKEFVAERCSRICQNSGIQKSCDFCYALLLKEVLTK